jgi:hypothetical protein
MTNELNEKPNIINKMSITLLILKIESIPGSKNAIKDPMAIDPIHFKTIQITALVLNV